MEKKKLLVNGKPMKCIMWALEEFQREFKPEDWQRQWYEKEFLDKLGLTPPKSFTTVAGSGTTLNIDDKPGIKEVYGVDVVRDCKHDEGVLKVYHYGFYKDGEKIIMPTMPAKLKGEHYVQDVDEFATKHDDSKNFKKKT